jgi:antitoxin FitA
MSKMIQIRHVPDALHRRLKAKAAIAGMSLSDFLLAELRRTAAKPTLDEWLQRLPQFGDEMDPPVAEVLREERDSS